MISRCTGYHCSGLTITSVTKLFSVSPTIEMLSKRMDDIGKVSTAKLLTEFQCETNMITKTADGMVSRVGVYARRCYRRQCRKRGGLPARFRKGTGRTALYMGQAMVCGDGWLNAVPTAFMISNGLLYLLWTEFSSNHAGDQHDVCRNGKCGSMRIKALIR